MPYSPKKPCKFPGCPKLTHGTYCEEHKKAEDRRYNRQERDPTSAKRYGSEWRKIRSRYIKANPLCEICLESSRLTSANTVHHIQTLKDGGTHDWYNLQSLCKECHSRLHAQQGERFKRKT